MTIDILMTGFEGNPIIFARGWLELDDAIGMLPAPEKDAYLEVERLAPDLIEAESDPYLFLRYDEFNAWAAARRLVAYWEE